MKVCAFILLVAFNAASFGRSTRLIDRLADFMETDGCMPDYSLVAEGSMGGLFGLRDLWSIHRYLRSAFPRFVGPRFTIGKSVESRSIEAFYVGFDEVGDTISDKPVVLITGLHHARELVTLSMIVQIVVQAVRSMANDCGDDTSPNNRLL